MIINGRQVPPGVENDLELKLLTAVAPYTSREATAWAFLIMDEYDARTSDCAQLTERVMRRLKRDGKIAFTKLGNAAPIWSPVS